MTVDLNPRFTFDTFVVGPSNRLAVTACRTVSDHPGATYNPLLIYGQTGLGKTHLLMAIGQRARELSPDMTVEYMTLDEFVESYHAAVSAGRPEDFRNRFAQASIVLVDDVQFLTHSKEMQAELIRMAGAFQEAERQLVLTSDRPPGDIEGLDRRLLDQMDGGLVVDIGLPEYETRLAILRQRAAESNAAFAPDVLAAIADLDVQHVRALLGIFNRLQAFQSVHDNPLTPQQARALVLGEAPTVEPEAQPGEGADADSGEFDLFLSGLQASVTRQVEGWKTEIQNAISEWSGRGYDTSSLEALLEQDGPAATDAAVRAFEEQVERLRGLEAEVTVFDPEVARNPAFKSPDRIEEVEALVRGARAKFVPPPGPSDAFALESFLLGDATKMALEAARAVIAQPGTLYNPLTFVGPSGVGKTHLLHALGRALQAEAGGSVACLAAETFVEELVSAIEQDALSAWRARYRHASAFLLDDVHQIGAKLHSQEELFHLFNLFADAKRQMVFTANVSPQDLEGLDDRLKSRFVGGLVANIGPPDDALRRTIVRSRLQGRVGSDDNEIVNYLADRGTDSVRSLLGVVQRAMNGAEAMGEQLNLETARKLLEEPGRAEARTSPPGRASGVIVTSLSALKSAEKIVWDWPNTTERVIEELS
ncbi:MAG: DnaA/Hda family protein [Gemmatimonadetes bacterium]|nr:DnaA/Hda family protein [Gemmatimonadota bacterium]